jgi:hypothetical protein
LNPTIRQAGESLENYFRKQRGVSLQRGKQLGIVEKYFYFRSPARKHPRQKFP